MRTNYHTHTTRCLHATGSDEEFVLSAIKGGYQELGFSDHTPWKYHTNYISDIRMTPEELPDYVESLRSLQEKYKDRISLKIGLECEYFPDYLHWLKEVIREFKLDYIIFGNHHFHTDEKFPYFGRNTKTVDMLELYEESVTEERVTVASQHILEVTGELIHIGMDVGISEEKGETEGFTELNLMYQMARAATAYRFIYGMGAVVTEGEMAQRALNGEQAPSSEELIQRLRQSDRTGFSAEYRKIVGELKKLSIQKAQDALMEIAGQMQTYRNSLQYRFEPLTKKDYEVLAGQLASYEYMDDVEEWFFRMAEEIWLILERNRQTGREDVVEKAIAYLQSNYGDPNISAQYLADKYHITPSYFSRLFHEKCGCTFPDYLAALRIERARELLLERENLSIQEICELVGYSNASYFTTSFKKKYGMTPGQFRRSQH